MHSSRLAYHRNMTALGRSVCLSLLLLSGCGAIRTSDENELPTADAGLDREVDEHTEVELLGTGDDPDGTIAGFLWEQTGGPDVALSNADTSVALFPSPTVVEPTELLFRFVVTDAKNATAEDDVRILVLPVNTPPTADAGPDRVVDEQTTVTLAGAGTDSDGSIEVVLWEQTDGPVVPLLDPTILDAAFEAPLTLENLSITYRLRVTDNEGGTAEDDVTFTILTVNTPPEADAGEDITADEQTAVTLLGSASDTDGAVVESSWAQVSGTDVVWDDAEPLQPTITTPTLVAGEELVFRLTVVDNEGDQSTDDISVFVQPVNAPPTVTVAADVATDEQTTVPVSGVAHDIDGTIAVYAWTQISGPTVSFDDSTVEATTIVTPVATSIEVLELQLEVTDNEGATAADSMFVTVYPVNAPPTADAGIDQAGAVGALITLTGTGVDTDGVVVGYAWNQTGGTNVSLLGAAGASVSFLGPGVSLQEILTFELTVTDDEGGTDTDTVTAVVSDSAGLMTPGTVLDFDTSDGGLTTAGALWDWGAPTNGPARAHTGTRGWATDTTGDYWANADEMVVFPLLDLTGVTDPTLSFRIWGWMWGAGDGTAMEIYEPGTGWLALPPDALAYNATAGGAAAWGGVGYQAEYAFAAVSLAAWAGSQVFVRLRFRSNPTLNASGTYIDDVGLHDESDDPDLDGIPGILDEFQVLGTDPFLDDTDGDGYLDGGEDLAGTDPLNPADYPGVLVFAPDTLLDLSAGDGGLATSGSLWAYGSAVNGPVGGHTGSQAWATNPSGNYTNNALESLYLPPVDLTTAVDPTLSFRIWMAPWGAGDGVSMEIKSNGAWAALAPDVPAYNGSASGVSSWTQLGYLGDYVFSATSLAPWVGQEVQIRFVFRSSATLTASGAYIDDIGLHEETSDPDLDGALGILDEFLVHGTDPLLADTDGDGELDGAEIVAGTDPLNPADWIGVIPLVPGLLLDFENGIDGDLSTDGTLWEYGVPSSGPGVAHSGVGVWATNVSGNYFASADEAVYLPPLDLAATTTPVLRFYLYMTVWGVGDALSVEVTDGTSGWLLELPSTPAYNGTGGGYPGWSSVGSGGTYELVEVPLSAWNGGLLWVRLVLRTSATLNSSGAYIDDIELVD